jgi:membrane associated rhomboid family serine protease
MLSRLPPVTRTLLIANIAVFILQFFLFEPLFVWFALWPFDPTLGVATGARGFMPWQLLTYGFLHGDVPHILLNMLALVMFGAQLEQLWGTRRFLIYYLVCVAGAGLCQLALGSWTVAEGGPGYPTVGASGGVFGLLLGYGVMFPNRRVMLLIPPIPMKARTLVIVYGVITLLLGFTGLQSGVAHFAHLGGMVFGWIMIAYWRRPRPPSPPSSGRKRPSHLKAVN